MFLSSFSVMCLMALTTMLMGQAEACPISSATRISVVNDGSTYWLCDNEIWSNAGGNSAGIMVASFTDALIAEPGLHKLATGWLCDVIYRHYGDGCYDDVTGITARNFMPAPNTTAAQLANTFQQGTDFTFHGQEGTCWNMMTDFHIRGLTTQALVLARDHREGEVRRCYLDTFMTRTFMAGLWVGFVCIGTLIFAILMAIVAVPSLVPYGICLGLLSK